MYAIETKSGLDEGHGQGATPECQRPRGRHFSLGDLHPNLVALQAPLATLDAQECELKQDH